MEPVSPTVMVVPYSGNPGALFTGLRHMRVERVALLVSQSQKKSFEPLFEDLKKFKVAFDVMTVRGGGLDEFFSLFSDIRSKYPHSQMVVNLGCADKMLTCGALAASFVNGWQAFDVEGEGIELMPVLKFDYYKLLSPKKLSLLQKISEKKEYDSLESLSQDAAMSLPLVSYHIRGSRKSEGMAQMGLVSINTQKGKIRVSVSPLGKLLLKGQAHVAPALVHPLR